MGVVNFDWNPDAIAKLVSLHAQGLSAGQIAYQFGGKMTRNMVCGKLGRLGIPALPVGKRSSLPRLHLVRPKPIPVVIPPEAPPLVLVRNKPVTIETLQPGMCKWPYGEGANIHFCASQSVPHEPWCPFHRSKAWVKGNPAPNRPVYTAEQQFFGGRR